MRKIKHFFTILWEWFWDDVSLIGKIHIFLMLGILIFCPLGVMASYKQGMIYEIINYIASFFFLAAFCYFLWFLDYMFETAHRRRIFYLMIIIFLGLCTFFVQYLTDDIEIRYAFAAASMFSVLLCVPAFLSYWHPPVYHYRDDD